MKYRCLCSSELYEVEESGYGNNYSIAIQGMKGQLEHDPVMENLEPCRVVLSVVGEWEAAELLEVLSITLDRIDIDGTGSIMAEEA